MHMRTLPIFLACLLSTGLWAQPDLFYNQGALVYVQANALVYVQGGMQTNDNGANDGVLENLGVIRCVDGTGGYRGNFIIGNNAEVNSRPSSEIYIQGNYHNNNGVHRSTGTHTANGNTTLGGTVIFNRGNSNGPQAFRIDNTSGVQQHWVLNNVIINNTAPLADRHVEISTAGNRDMWIDGTLTLTSGRIHALGNLSSGANVEVRIRNTAAGAIVRPTWPPATAAAFATLVAPDNQHQYIYGRLRRNVTASTAYNYPVGGPYDTRGIQGMVLTPGHNGYVRVQFDPTVQSNFNNPPYCRPGDSGPNRQYNPLNNGRWEIQPYASVDATAITNPTSGSHTVTMYNRVVSNATTNGNCPAAGATVGLPGGSDPVWNNYPTDLCYVGYNQSGTGQLTPPNNCDASNNGWTVPRSGFGPAYNMNGTYYYATVIANNAPLPSDDIRLAAAPAGSAIALTWEVTPEREYVLGYELHRSTDGVNFSRIAQVDKQGRTTYYHRDAYVQPLTRYFYRAEQHDIFGNIRYSNTVEAMLPASGESFTAQLQPNPVVSEAYLLLSLPAEGPVSFQLYDAAGKLVAKADYTLSAGVHQLDLSNTLALVAAGNYNALVSYGGEVRTLRLIKADLTR